jgi:hypothetical protein
MGEGRYKKRPIIGKFGVFKSLYVRHVAHRQLYHKFASSVKMHSIYKRPINKGYYRIKLHRSFRGDYVCLFLKT